MQEVASIVGRVRHIVARLPQHEFDVRRLFARDEQFRSICLDFEEAAAALRRWQDAPGGRSKAEHYLKIMDELEAEILELLATSVTAANHPE